LSLNNLNLAQFLSRIGGSPFLANVTQLVSGEVVAQVVGFVALPLLTRIYGPAAFGILGVFMAVSEVGGKIASLRYDVALILPERDHEAWALFRFSATFALCFTSVLLCSTFPFRNTIATSLGVAELDQFFLFVSLMMLGISCQSLGSYWVMRKKHFKAIAEASAGSAVIGSGLKVLVGFLGYGAGGLLLVTALQRWLNLLLIRLRTPSSIWKHPVAEGESQLQARVYIEFPKYRMPQDTLNSFTQVIPNVLLAAFFSPVAAGFYILASRILRLPFSLLQEALRKVFYVKAIEISRSGDSLFKLCSGMSLLIFVSVLPVAVMVIWWGSTFFEYVFGAEWREAGIYAKWIIIGVLFGFSALPSSVVIPIMGWNRFYLCYEILTSLLRLIIAIWVAATMTVYSTVAAIILSASASSFVLMCIVLTRLRNEEHNPVTASSNSMLS